MAKLSEVAPAVSSGWNAPFLDGEEKRAAVGSVFTLHAVEYDPDNIFGPRWLVGVEDVATGSRWTITLRANPGRDKIMHAIRAALDEGVVLDPVVFTYVAENTRGNAPYGFVDATDQQVAEAKMARAEAENRKAVNEVLGEA